MAAAHRRSRLTEADRADWANFTSRIRPLSGRPQTPPATTAPTAPGPRPRPTPVPHRPSAPQSPVAIGQPPGGVDRATWQRFRSGRLRAAKVLDLHGQTAQRAFQSLLAFLRTAQADQLRCVEIVTGRGAMREPGAGYDPAGTGVLRRELPIWLNRPDIRPLILAAAHPHAANPGSVRLLLRRTR
jgi:DNA-nicking Smr family endonuclease